MKQYHTSEQPDQLLHTTFAELHAMPEIGFNEVKTSAYLADALEQCGFKVTRNVGKTGVVGVLDSGKPGTGFALRADMDALPFERDGEKVAIHACGHDANSSMALTAARRAAKRGITSGRLYIVFQQAEELVGAMDMAKSGGCEGIDEMVGVHLRPKQEAGLGAVIHALYHSASYFVTLAIRGRTAHGARPHLGVNALDAAAAIVLAAGTIHVDPTIPYSIKATQLQTVGNSVNTIPDFCTLSFDIRSESNVSAAELIEKLRSTAQGVCDGCGAKLASFEYHGIPAAELDGDLVKLCEQAVKDVMGSSLGSYHTAGGEDIHYFHQLCGIKIGYIGIGADLEPGLHAPDMHFDPRALDVGADVLEQIVKLRLGYNDIG